MRRHWRAAAAAVAFGFFSTLNTVQAQSPNLLQVPEVYKFGSGWPKPLPNDWVMGTVTGLTVDQDDHIWVLDRPGDTLRGKTAAPAVLEFDMAGNLLRSWGTPASAPSASGPDKSTPSLLTTNTMSGWPAPPRVTRCSNSPLTASSSANSATVVRSSSGRA